jgi:hypothetical protein
MKIFSDLLVKRWGLDGGHGHCLELLKIVLRTALALAVADRSFARSNGNVGRHNVVYARLPAVKKDGTVT